VTGEIVSHYRILEKLGEGGMGVVYKAEDLKLRRTVALKFLPKNDTENRERFLREAQAAASLNHPNICTIHEIDEAGGFIAMEYIEGRSVKEKIEARPLPVDEAVDIATQACAGLQAAHEKGIIHRDIKPANLMLTAQGQLKIMDFGLAHMVDRTCITKVGASIGTPAYMSPEQAKGEPTDRRTDLWSLGVTVYEMLTGRTPFPGGSEAALTYGIVHTHPEPPTALRSGLPKDLDRIVSKLLAKDPQSRYQHAADLVVDLRASRPAESPSRNSLRRRILVGGLISAPIVGLALAGGRALLQRTGIRSLAIMPLATMGSAPDMEHLSEGLAESLTYALAQLREVQVMSRSAVARQSSRGADPIAAGIAMGVDGIVTGRITTQAANLAVSIELVEVRNGRNVWGSRFTRKASELPLLQEEIAGELAGALRAKLSEAQQQQLERRQTRNGDAYNLYLKGRYFWRRWAPADLRKAVEYLEQAIAIDPNYALAYAALADTWLIGDHAEPPSETAPKSKRMALRAVQLDSSLSEAHVALAMVKLVLDWDWPGAEAEFRKAIECDPKNVDAYRWFGTFNLRLGRNDTALDKYRRAVQLDPTDTLSQQYLGSGYYWIGRYPEAVTVFRSILELNPEDARTHLALGLALSEMGEYREAVRELEFATTQRPTDSNIAAARGYALARAGSKSEARGVIRELEQLRAQRYVSAASFATIHAGLGDIENALRWCDKAYEERTRWLVHLKGEPRLANLRAEARFQELVRKIGLP
jgi:eukaryotic-like serine/threonine-protein kinase